MHSITLACAGLVCFFLASTGGYLAVSPAQDTDILPDRGLTAIAGPLRRTCVAATAGAVALNAVMLFRVVLEVTLSLLERGIQTLRAPSPRTAHGPSRSTPLLDDAVGRLPRSRGGNGIGPSTERGEGFATAIGIGLALFGAAE